MAAVGAFAVESQNIVGYVNEGVTKGNFNALGVPFTSADGTGFQLNSITGDGLYSDGTFDGSDQIWIWNPLTSTYDMWYYYTDSTHVWDGWYDQVTGEIPFADRYPNGLEPGASVWFVSHANSTGGTATFPGAVEGADTYTVTVNQGNFNLFANPFPVAFKFNDSQVDWSEAFSDGTFDGSDQIWIWNPATSTYDMWYYYTDSTHVWDGWYDQVTGEIPFEDKYPEGLPAGSPVWYVAKGTVGAENTFDVTFTNPIK